MLKNVFRWPLLFTLIASACAQVAVTTHHNDNSRTGQNLQETTLTTSNVNVSNFGKLFTRSVDGQAYAQPLYVSGLSIGGQGAECGLCRHRT